MTTDSKRAGAQKAQMIKAAPDLLRLLKAYRAAFTPDCVVLTISDRALRDETNALIANIES